MTRLASVQRFHLRLGGITDDTLYLADGRPRAIFGITTADPRLLDDDELEVLVARLEAFVRGLEEPWQLVFRLAPADLDAHAADLDALAAGRAGRLATAGRELAAFVRHLGRTAGLLRPELYLVVGLDGPPVGLLGRLRTALAGLWSGGGHRRAADPDAPTATERLDALGEAVAAGLERLGADWHRLDDAEIADLVGRCWAPPRARRVATGRA